MTNDISYSYVTKPIPYNSFTKIKQRLYHLTTIILSHNHIPISTRPKQSWQTTYSPQQQTQAARLTWRRPGCTGSLYYLTYCDDATRRNRFQNTHLKERNKYIITMKMVLNTYPKDKEKIYIITIHEMNIGLNTNQKTRKGIKIA